MIKKTKRLEKHAACSMNYIALFLELAEEKGWNRQKWLLDNNITPSMIENIDDHISFEDLGKFVNIIPEIWEIPGLGLDMGKKLQLSTNGILAYAIMGSETYMEGIKIFRRFHQIREQIMQFDLEEVDDTLLFQFKMINEIAPGLEQFCFESALSGTHTFLQSYLGVEHPIGELYFAYPEPEYSDLYYKTFGNNVTFNAKKNEIKVPKKLLERPAHMANQAVSSVAQQQCEAILKDLIGEDSLVDKLYHSIYSKPWRIPTQEETANDLCMSVRTLRRKLNSLGTSYQDVVNSVSETIAVKFLEETDWPIDEISSFLGYSEKTNFSRAFKRWTGKTPASYRVSEAA